MNYKGNSLRIILIGAYPPPYGGVSVHIQRLQELLSNRGFQCTVFDFNSSFKNNKDVISARRIGNWRYVVSNRKGLVHIHTSGISMRKLICFIVFSALCKAGQQKVLITFHSFRECTTRFVSLGAVLLKALSKLLDNCIVVSPQIKRQLVSLNLASNKVSVVAAFLPPIAKESDILKVPPKVESFISTHRPVISANAFRMAFFKGQDLYGIDMCVELCHSLKRFYPQIGIVFCLSNVGDASYYYKIKQTIKERSIAENFLFITQSCPFYPILAKSSAFVRPTSTDGDSISIREAMYCGIPAIASDAVPRPKGTILFKNRDGDDFLSKVREVIDNYAFYKKSGNLNLDDNFERILHIYE